MQPPKIPSFFKTKRPAQFYFEPRYYNERKEKMEERYNRISKELSNDNKGERTDANVFRSSLRDNWASSSRHAQGSAVNKRVLFYIILLVAIAYYFLR
ncbi:MAG: hypothetical protein HS119_11915 [Flavobacteriales bacterium]|nr:hypothetical protein [Flavobacteriales bacterium]MCL4855954.1 hypothetical protein [Flavobacteriales bacterium]